MENAQFDLLLSLTDITAASVQAACRSVLVAGLTQKNAAALHGVNESQLSRRLKSIRRADEIASQLAKYYTKNKNE